MIRAENITKSFGSLHALKDVSLEVQEGELFGLIGPDGAGKTTLFRILTTLLLPDSGMAEVSGWDIRKGYRKIRQQVGYMPGKFSLYPDLTVEENLQFFATVFGTSIRENYALIKDIYSQIEPFKDRKAGALSGGMKQKLALSCALVHRPRVLFMDEPTTGIDPVSRKELWEMLRGLRKQGITMMVSTPYMDEASLCERVALIQNGRLMAVDRPEVIEQSFSRPLWSVSSGSSKYRLLQDLRHYPLTLSAFAFGEKVHVTMQDNFIAEDLQQYLLARGHQPCRVERQEPGIEDRFMELMNIENQPTT